MVTLLTRVDSQPYPPMHARRAAAQFTSHALMHVCINAAFFCEFVFLVHMFGRYKVRLALCGKRSDVHVPLVVNWAESVLTSTEADSFSTFPSKPYRIRFDRIHVVEVE